MLYLLPFYCPPLQVNFSKGRHRKHVYIKKRHKKSIANYKQDSLHSPLLMQYCVGTDNGIHSYMHQDKIRLGTA